MNKTSLMFRNHKQATTRGRTEIPVAMDIYETGQQLVLELDLPGIAPDLIRITQHGMICQIEAETRPEVTGDTTRYLCMERRFGQVRHSIRLPDNTDPNGIRAEYRNGMLRLICPIAQKHSILVKELK
jgi:HSP20 family protein